MRDWIGLAVVVIGVIVWLLFLIGQEQMQIAPEPFGEIELQTM